MARRPSPWGIETRPRMRTRSKQVKVSYNFEGFLKPNENPEDWTPEDVTPRFIVQGYKVENWCLEACRRKFMKLRAENAPNYLIDSYLPKAYMIMKYVMSREMIPLTELSQWLGLSKGYLKELARRDPRFRRRIWMWRQIMTDQQRDRALGAILDGEKTILETFLPHFTATNRGNGSRPYKDPIDVGWKPRNLSKKR